MKKIVFILSSILGIGSTVHAQSTTATNVYAPGRFLGYTGNNFLEIRTNNIVRALFTTGNSLNSWNGNAGDGLKILAPPNSTGDISLFTSNSPIFGGNETHAVFGGSGQISGQNNRFEFISTGASMGNYYSTFSATGIHRFDRGTTEQGRLGTNNN